MSFLSNKPSEQSLSGTEGTLSKLQLKNVNKSFGGLRVLENLSLEVKANEIVSILGPSGCGKSTLFNIISGIEKADSGEIFLDNEACGKEILGRVSYMNQKDLLLPWRSLMDNISLPYLIQGMKGIEAKKKILPLLQMFGLEGFENEFPQRLSGGMRQRGAFLRTLIQNKELVLLDEPFASLDSMTRRAMYTWFLELRTKLNFTAVIITHDMEEAMFLSDRIYKLRDRPSTVIDEIYSGS